MIGRLFHGRGVSAGGNIADSLESLCVRESVAASVELAKFTSLRIGGTAEYFSQPKSREQLVSIVETCRKLGVPYRVMGRGSNLFITSQHLDGVTIRNTEACDSIEFDGNRARVGASVSLQVLLKQAAERGLGGFEYLHSVPGNMGGAIFMNAGRGEIANRNISDHVVNVEVLHEGRIKTFSRRQCRFGYRKSIFQTMSQPIVLSAELRLNRMDVAEAKQLLIDRIQFCKEKQDNTAPNAGSVFRYGFELGQELKDTSEGGASFSSKTTNWILNRGGSSASDVKRLIEMAKRAHEERNLPSPTLEWTMW